MEWRAALEVLTRCNPLVTLHAQPASLVPRTRGQWQSQSSGLMHNHNFNFILLLAQLSRLASSSHSRWESRQRWCHSRTRKCCSHAQQVHAWLRGIVFVSNLIIQLISRVASGVVILHVWNSVGSTCVHPPHRLQPQQTLRRQPRPPARERLESVEKVALMRQT